MRTFYLACIILQFGANVLVAQPPAPDPSASTAAAAAHAGKAIRLMQERNYEDAAAEFEQSLAANPDDDNLRIQYATCLFAQERNDGARRQFEILHRKKGDWPGLEYYLGILDYRTGDFASAIRRLQPLKANTAFTKASFYIGLAYQSTGQTALALENLERAARDNPSDPEVHYRLGRICSMGGRTEEADREYKLYRDLDDSRRLVEDDGNSCRSALHSQPVDKARPICLKIIGSGIEESGDSQRLILLGQLYTQAGAFADALAPLQRAAQLDPGSFDAWNYLGQSLFYLHRYQDALAPLKKAVALNPRFFDALNLLAATLHTLGDDISALPFLERAHSLNPDDAAVSGALEKMRAAVRGKQ